MKGFPFELGIGARGQISRVLIVLPGPESLTISSAIWIQHMNVKDGQTDRQTDIRTDRRTPGDSKERAYA